jgi:hypothetical protein
MTTPEELEKRMQVLEDVEAIRKLKTRYGQLVDARFDSSGRLKEQKDLDSIAQEIVELFTDDGAWDRGEKLGVLKGKKQIYDHFRLPGYSFHAHYFLNDYIVPEGNKASGDWYLWLPGTKDDGTAIWLSAVSHDEYVKINGKWLFALVKSHILFLTPYDQGWAKQRLGGVQDKADRRNAG